MARTVLRTPPRLPLVAASILGADFAEMGAACARSVDAGSDLLHLDVMDGHFVPNLTMGPALCKSIRAVLPDACLDVHLMVTDPADFVAPFRDAGADHLTFHVEAVDDPVALAKTIRDEGMTAGIAINPPTPVERVLPFVDAVDLVLVMSVNPGFAGQAFIGDVLAKAAPIRERLPEAARLQIDGGVNEASVASCRDAGFDVLVAASAIFGASDWTEAVAMLRGSGVTQETT